MNHRAIDWNGSDSLGRRVQAQLLYEETERRLEDRKALLRHAQSSNFGSGQIALLRRQVENLDTQSMAAYKNTIATPREDALWDVCEGDERCPVIVLPNERYARGRALCLDHWRIATGSHADTARVEQMLTLLQPLPAPSLAS